MVHGGFTNLERLGRNWDLLATASVLRDRHFVNRLRKIVSSSACASITGAERT
jgi:hypothetical protein